MQCWRRYKVAWEDSSWEFRSEFRSSCFLPCCIPQPPTKLRPCYIPQPPTQIHPCYLWFFSCRKYTHYSQHSSLPERCRDVSQNTRISRHPQPLALITNPPVPYPFTSRRHPPTGKLLVSLSFERLGRRLGLESTEALLPPALSLYRLSALLPVPWKTTSRTGPVSYVLCTQKLSRPPSTGLSKNKQFKQQIE